jgi:hypothetical protein
MTGSKILRIETLIIATATFTLLILGATGASSEPPGGGNGNGNGGGGGGGGDPAHPVIAYLANGHLMVMDADGSNQTRVLSKAGSIYTGLSWSPDGMQILFNDGGANVVHGLYTVNLDGTGETLVTPYDSPYRTGGEWSPVPADDGQHKIVFRGDGDL